MTDNQQLLSLFMAALERVKGKPAVMQALQQHPMRGPFAALAIGKAASSMMEGVISVAADQLRQALVITKQGYASTLPGVSCLESAHPVPDQRSLLAGEAMIRFLQSLPEGMPLLVLMSGGASSLVEKLPQGMSLEELRALNQWLLSSGLDIHSMNRIRQHFSTLKGGRALAYVAGHAVCQFLISDVPSDDPTLIGSGLFVPATEGLPDVVLPEWLQQLYQRLPLQPVISGAPVEIHLVATNALACEAVARAAGEQGLVAHLHADQPLQGDAYALAKQLAQRLRAAPAGVHIWGGETTVVLPEKPGRGGRNQALALALALALEGEAGISVLVAGTDGSDGPTEDAGAIITGSSCEQIRQQGFSPQSCLQAADAGSCLQEIAALVSTGPTGTNVMDLLIALKSA